jgi:hypothetical protein
MTLSITILMTILSLCLVANYSDFGSCEGAEEDFYDSDDDSDDDDADDIVNNGFDVDEKLGKGKRGGTNE